MKKFIILVLLILIYCSKSTKVTARITEPQGLILRDSPDQNSKNLALMKYNEEVNIIQENGPEETLHGITSKWVEVEYKGLKGFAFGGFLDLPNSSKTKIENPSKNQEIDDKLLKQKCSKITESIIDSYDKLNKSATEEEKYKSRLMLTPVLNKECESGKYDLECLSSVNSVLKYKDCKLK